MPMTLPAAEARIRREVPAAEAGIDDALLQTINLMATVLAARRDVGASADAGQAVLMRLAKTQNSLIEAQCGILRAHSELRKAGEIHGIGDDGTCPPSAIDGYKIAA
ncbi:hypothetical protein ACOYW6_07730 [Parablastomonas sp. CN1-191]|uniref:hypothetical protein n=1 Tax=Parablastomonas sp. CN1-191 TaxID=3400908 RepID=UPI003BF8FC5F